MMTFTTKTLKQNKMEREVKEIYDILVQNQSTCKIGSDGDYSQELCVFADDFEYVAEQIAEKLKETFK